jgi:serine/threonine-protein kinase
MMCGLLPGTIIANKYRIDRIIGSGGMGLVVQATHLELREPVAIKVLLPEVSQNPEASARFLREARAAARLKGVHVARSTDVGKLENGQRYMVMEYLDGSDLASLLSSRGALPLRKACEFILQSCEAVAEAHEHGIIHRDLKPANLFVVSLPDGSDSIKVLDFGISKAIDLQSSRNPGLQTGSQSMLGTPLYASPEQLLSSASVDERTDIWSLGGVVFYELLTGSRPFEGRTLEEIIARVVSCAPTPLRYGHPEIPGGIEQVIMTCLEKDRSRRYASIADLVEALVAVSATEIDAESQVLASRIVRSHHPTAPQVAHGSASPSVPIGPKSSAPPVSMATQPSNGGGSNGNRLVITEMGLSSTRNRPNRTYNRIGVVVAVLLTIFLVVFASIVLVIARRMFIPTRAAASSNALVNSAVAPIPPTISAPTPLPAQSTHPSSAPENPNVIPTRSFATSPSTKTTSMTVVLPVTKTATLPQGSSKEKGAIEVVPVPSSSINATNPSAQPPSMSSIPNRGLTNFGPRR